MLCVRGLESVPLVDLALARSSQKEAVGDIGEVDPVNSGWYPVDNVRSCSISNHCMGVSTPVSHRGYGHSVEPVCTHRYLQLPTIDLCDIG